MERKLYKRSRMLLFAAAAGILCLCRSAYAREMESGGQSLGALRDRGISAESASGGRCREHIRCGRIEEIVSVGGVTDAGAYVSVSCGGSERRCYFAIPNLLDKLRVLMYDLTQRNEFYYFWEGSYNENEKSIICHVGGGYDDVFDGRLRFWLFRHRVWFWYRWS